MIEDVISSYKRKKKSYGCWNRVKKYPSLFNGRQTMKICYAGQHIYDLARQLTMRIDSNFCVLSPIQIFESRTEGHAHVFFPHVAYTQTDT